MRLMTAGVVALLFGPAPLAMADPVYEGFAQPIGQLVNQGGGSGFSSNWTAGGFNASSSTNYQVAAGSLGYGLLQTSGGRATTGPTGSIAGAFRSLSEPFGLAGTTRYMSFLFRPEGPLVSHEWGGLYLGSTSTSDDQLFIGKPGGGAAGELVFERRGGGDQLSSGISLVSGETYLVLLKMEFLAGNDILTLYVNPQLGTEPASGGVVKTNHDLNTVNVLGLYSTAGYSIDELRIGSTYAEVTPVVPTPTAAAGGGVLLIGGALRRRRLAGA